MHIPRRSLRLWQVWSAPIILTALTLPGITQGDFRTDTHVYTAITQLMIDTGDWVHLRIGDAPYANKPPLAFWFAAPFVWALGPTLAAVRLASLAWGIIACLGTFALTKRLANRKLAATTTIVLVLTHEFFRYTRAFSLDLPLVACLVWATAWAVAALDANTKWTQPACLAGVALGAGLMTKPAVALLAPAILCLWWAWDTRDSRTSPARLLRLGLTTAIGLAVAAPWHIAAFTANTNAASTYIVDQSIGRGLGTTFQRDPWWYYASSIAEHYWPWLIPCALGLILAPAAIRARSVHARALRHAIVTIALWLIALTIFADKRSRYLVPVYPAASTLAAFALIHLGSINARRTGRRIVLWLPVGVAVLSLIATLGTATGLLQLHPPAPQSRAELRIALVTIGALQPTTDNPAAFGDFEPTERTIWISPNTERPAARIYLDTGVYPSSLPAEQTPTTQPTTPTPKPGDALLIELRKGQPRYTTASPATHVGDFGEWRLLVIGQRWDGLELQIQQPTRR